MIGLLISVLILTGALSTIYLLLNLDGIVHGQLYSYGLQFSLDWANPYWGYMRLSLFLLGAISVLAIVNLTYFFWKRKEKKLRVPRFQVQQPGGVTHKMNRTKKTAPVWITTVCILATIFSLMFSTLAYVQNYQVSLPFVVDITFRESDLKVEGIDFSYNASTVRYTKIIVDVRNWDNANPHKGTIDVKLLTVGGVEAAKGFSGTGTINPNVTVAVEVALRWNGNYTVIDLVSGPAIQLQQTS